MSIVQKAKTVWRQRRAIRPILEFSTPSYSQYGEDFMFQRLLQPGPEGTYVDAGANHPIHGSNTFRQYCAGWRGICVDPNPTFAPLYEKYRPHDLLLVEGIAKEAGSLTYHEFETDSMNTFDPEVARTRMADGHHLMSKAVVPCRPLSEIVDQHIPGRQIDLLNVDCEGLDLEVLQSLDLRSRRPTVIIVEDYLRLLTLQQGSAPADMERFLRDQGYVPLAQMAWSVLYMADDWRELFKRSMAFDEKRVSNGYLPGQFVG